MLINIQKGGVVILANKKGISPLIATVLIIGFTVIAAVLVITWINNLVGGQTDLQQCKAQALEQCVQGIGDFTFGKIGTIGVDLQGTILNTGPDTVDFQAVYLIANGQQSATCTSGVPVTVGPFATIQTLACSDASVTTIRFIQLVTSNYAGVDCTEICGDGTPLDVT